MPPGLERLETKWRLSRFYQSIGEKTRQEPSLPKNSAQKNSANAVDVDDAVARVITAHAEGLDSHPGGSLPTDPQNQQYQNLPRYDRYGSFRLGKAPLAFIPGVWAGKRLAQSPKIARKDARRTASSINHLGFQHDFEVSVLPAMGSVPNESA